MAARIFADHSSVVKSVLRNASYRSMKARSSFGLAAITAAICKSISDPPMFSVEGSPLMPDVDGLHEGCKLSAQLHNSFDDVVIDRMCSGPKVLKQIFELRIGCEYCC